MQEQMIVPALILLHQERPSSSKFVCEAWSKSIPYLNRATIQATFREVFEP